jgi:hypothetical protein
MSRIRNIEGTHIHRNLEDANLPSPLKKFSATVKQKAAQAPFLILSNYTISVCEV